MLVQAKFRLYTKTACRVAMAAQQAGQGREEVFQLVVVHIHLQCGWIGVNLRQHVGGVVLALGCVMSSEHALAC